MKVRYKKYPNISRSSYHFNLASLNEILVGDDSPPISEMEVWLVSKNEWVDMATAFHDKDLITDNYNTEFFEPRTPEDRERGFTLD